MPCPSRYYPVAALSAVSLTYVLRCVREWASSGRLIFRRNWRSEMIRKCRDCMRYGSCRCSSTSYQCGNFQSLAPNGIWGFIWWIRLSGRDLIRWFHLYLISSWFSKVIINMIISGVILLSMNYDAVRSAFTPVSLEQSSFQLYTLHYNVRRKHVA